MSMRASRSSEVCGSADRLTRLVPRRAATNAGRGAAGDPRRDVSRLRWPRCCWRLLRCCVCFSRGYLLLYGDAVAHLGIARRILDSRNPGLVQLGGVWLPLPHLLMLPFVQKMEWWQNGLAGAWPSLICYIAERCRTLPAARGIC